MRKASTDPLPSVRPLPPQRQVTGWSGHPCLAAVKQFSAIADIQHIGKQPLGDDRFSRHALRKGPVIPSRPKRCNSALRYES